MEVTSVSLNSILVSCLLIAIGIIGYFLRQLHQDFKEYMKEHVKELAMVKENHTNLYEKVIGIETAAKKDFENLSQMTNIKLDYVAKAMQDMSLSLAEMTKTMVHLDGNQKVVTNTLERFMKMEDRILELEKHENSR